MDPRRQSDDDDAGRAFVETRQDARLHVASITQSTQDRIQQRSAGLLVRRMHDHPGGLVDGDEVVVLVKHVEEARFGLRALTADRRAGNRDGNFRPFSHADRGSHRHAPIDGNGSRFDPLPGDGPRKMPHIANPADEHLVEPQPRVAAIRNKLERRGWTGHLNE